MIVRALLTGFLPLLLSACARPAPPAPTSAGVASAATPTANAAMPPGSASAGDPRTPLPLRTSLPVRTSLQVLSHDIELAVSLDPPSLTGTGSVRVRATQPTAVLVLDAKKLAVSQVLVESQPVQFEQTPELVWVTLPEPLAAGSERTLRFEWRADTAGNAPQFTQDEMWAGYQTPAWMPTVQDSAQRATLALHVTASAGLKVGASGRQVAQQPLPDGRVRHSFLMDRPSPPFLYAFTVGRFEAAELRVDDMLLRALGPPGVDLSGALEATGSMYRFLKGKLGVGHPWGEYLQVFVAGDVAQEAAGMALIGAQALSDLRADPQDDWVFIHELSHQWFGWQVPCADFADFWLNEGFATFMVGAFEQAHWGAAAYETELQNWRAASARARAEERRDGPIALSSPTGAERPSPRESELQSNGVTYFRGALVLHRLRGELGEEAFWRGIRLYLSRFAGKSARTLDLRRTLEEASGRDLEEFFQRWIYTTATDP